MDVEDGLGEERGDTKFCQFFVGFTLWTGGDGIENNNLFHLRVGDPFISWSTQKTMTCEGEDTTGALFYQNVGSLTESTGSIDHIIDQDTVTVLDVTDKVHTVNETGTGTLLYNHSEADVWHLVLVHEALLELLGTVHTTGIRTDDDRVVQILRSEIIEADDTTVQVVDGDSRSEETLDLSTMQIDSDDTIHAHRLHQTSDVSSRNRDAGLHFTILSCVSVVRDDDSDTASTGPSKSRDHKQQFHDVVIDRGTGRLDDVTILPTDILMDDDVRFTVGEPSDGRLAEVDTKVPADLQRQR
mmetsp:Transcript_2908/g.6451  ORF Transcript_2908/g.6451 Transcript_2908/m.6451 type:complete len:299 (-) Transcript_2908:597-1493(-)